MARITGAPTHKARGRTLILNCPAADVEVIALVAFIQSELSPLREALEEIRQVASGENQVADDDTAGMAWVDRRATAALDRMGK